MKYFTAYLQKWLRCKFHLSFGKNISIFTKIQDINIIHHFLEELQNIFLYHLEQLLVDFFSLIKSMKKPSLKATFANLAIETSICFDFLFYKHLHDSFTSTIIFTGFAALSVLTQKYFFSSIFNWLLKSFICIENICFNHSHKSKWVFFTSYMFKCWKFNT